MEIGVNSWSVETVVVVNDGDDGLVVADDNAQETIHEALEEEAANKETSTLEKEMEVKSKELLEDVS